MATIRSKRCLGWVVTASTTLLVVAVLTPFVFFPLAAVPYALTLAPLVVAAALLALRRGLPISEPLLAAWAGALVASSIWAIGLWALALTDMAHVVPRLLFRWQGLVSAAMFGSTSAAALAFALQSGCCRARASSH